MKLPDILYTISNQLNKIGGKAIVVGGCVRDYFLNLQSKDYDIEVYGLTNLDELENILQQFGQVNLVGKSFGVLKFSHNNEQYDFSFARTESKISDGHKGFKVELHSDITYKEGAKRRDFTINSIGYDIQKKTFLDPYGGIDDIKQSVLKYVNKDSFIEDPLRVYRAVQFCARFRFDLDNDTFILCKNMVANNLLKQLPKERIYDEIKKLLLKSDKPSIGFNMILKMGIVKHLSPLEYLVKNNLWDKTINALDIAKSLLDSNAKNQLKLLFAILCRNFTEEQTKEFLSNLTNEVKLINSILPLIKYYPKVNVLYNNANNYDIKKLATKVNIQELVIVAYSDSLNYKAKEWLLNKAKKLGVQNKPLKPLVTGDDLIQLGLKPSSLFKTILDDLYDMQLKDY